MKHVSPADIEEVDDARKSPGYRQIREYLARAFSDKLHELLKPGGLEETANLRGFLQGLQFSIDAPETLLREMREAAKRQKPVNE